MCSLEVIVTDSTSKGSPPAAVRSSISAGARPLPVRSTRRPLVGAFEDLEAARGDDVQRAGVATSTISHRERQGATPTPERHQKLVRLLGIRDLLTVAEFRDAILQGEGQPPDS